jgi:epoxyqueuosine reductase
MHTEEINYRKVKDIALGLGFSLFGVAELADLEELAFDLSPSTIRNLRTGIALGVRLSDGVLDDITDHPTRLYLHHYRQTNYFLDRNSWELAREIEEMGATAMAIAASQTIDWINQRGHLSHKEVARRAGLGWIGRNNLLVTPKYGSRIRLVTILTDLPLRSDQPLERDCGACRRCVELCPAGAIAEKPSEFDHIKCYEQLGQFKKGLNLGHYICGICVKACDLTAIEN